MLGKVKNKIGFYKIDFIKSIHNLVDLNIKHKTIKHREKASSHGLCNDYFGSDPKNRCKERTTK
jgi:hypothetical protein